MKFGLLVFAVLVYSSASLFSQDIKQSARIVNVGTEVKFWVDGAKENPEWQISVIRDNNKEDVKKLDGFEISYVPDEVGSFIVQAEIGKKVASAYFEAIRFNSISFQRKPAGADNFSPVKGGNIEKNIVMVGDTVRYDFSSEPVLASDDLRWLEDGAEVGKGNGLARQVKKIGRVKIQAQLADIISPVSLMTIIDGFKITSVKNDSGVAITDVPVTVGSELYYSCEIEPKDFAPQDIEWGLVSGDGNFHTLSQGLIGASTMDVVGSLTLIAKAGEVSTPPKTLFAVGAGLLRYDFIPQNYLVVSKFENAFDKDGRLKKNFIENDTDRFYIEISDPSKSSQDTIELRTVFEKTVLTDWTKFMLSASPNKGKRMAGPFISVSDDVDKIDIRAFKAVLGGRLEVRYKGVSMGSIIVGARPDEISENAIRTVDVNVIILNDPKTKSPVLNSSVIQNYIKIANQRWAQANIRFNLKSLKFADPPANMLVVSGRANGISQSGAKGFVHFFINDIEVSCNTYLNKSARATAEELIAQMPSGFNVKRLGALSMGDEKDFAFVISSTKPVEIKLDRTLTDTGQHIIAGGVDLSSGIEVGFFQDELSIEELALSMLGDGGPSAINIIIANKLQRQGAELLGRAYPEGLYNENMADTILLSSALGDGSPYPFFLSKMLGQILLKTTDLITEPTNIMWQGDAKENKINSSKRLTLEQVKKIREFYDYKMPSLLQKR